MALVLYNPNPLPFLQAFNAENRTFTLGNEIQPITIKQEWNEHGVAAVVWEAALILGTYLMNMKNDVQDKTVLELGSGTGFCGIVACLLGADVMFTDLKESLHTCKMNIDTNLDSTQHKFSVKPLNWKDDLAIKWSNKSFDYVIGADLVYIEDTFQDLVNTFKYFQNNNKDTILLLSGKIRYKERFDKFKTILEESFLLQYLQYNENTNLYLLKLQAL